ncbi:hypothetical protein [Stenotrophomonas sp.]|uniref:hypothetical protein n=1 Tax=Stenotrophomonas sp. TaxID=69392 RepID=UPI0029AF7CF4|nr:hypothetical protein [Stenotrophomonas sp.]MDX3936479.1 hypothetical protein [Stenotrophomonas sp.]
MQPQKTDLARTALQAHRAPLDMRQRRLLILCDGQRDLVQLGQLVGPETPAMVIQLIQSGYLVSHAVAEAAVVAPAAPALAPGVMPTVAPVPATSERRRSLVAARIYLLDILELQRHPQAASLFHALQQSRSDEAVLAALYAALEALPGLTSTGYAERVRQRLLEVLPKEHADRFLIAVI